MKLRAGVRVPLRPSGFLALVALFALLLIGSAACAALPGTPDPSETPGIRVVVVTATPRPTLSNGTESVVPTPTASPSPRATTPPPPTSTPAPSPTLTPLPSPTAVSNLVVVQPSEGQLVSSPIRVQGMARAFEATIEVAVVVGGKQIAHTGVHTSAGAPEWGSFDTVVDADVPGATQPVDGEVRVMIPSMKDGGYAEVVTIPVRIRPGAGLTPTVGTRVVKVYFSRVVDNQITFVAVNRTIPWTLAVGRASLEELIRGPTTAEKAAGLETSVPPGTKVLGLTIKNGVAYADFDRTLQKGAQGSAAIYALTQQIRLTLLQFSTIKQVVISVEGKTQGILEP